MILKAGDGVGGQRGSPLDDAKMSFWHGAARLRLPFLHPAIVDDNDGQFGIQSLARSRQRRPQIPNPRPAYLPASLQPRTTTTASTTPSTRSSRPPSSQSIHDPGRSHQPRRLRPALCPVSALHWPCPTQHHLLPLVDLQPPASPTLHGSRFTEESRSRCA